MEKITTNGNGELKESLVICQTSLGAEVRGTLIKLTRFMVVFEIYNPTNVLRTSEVLSDFRIIVNDHTIYSGNATVRHLMNMGQMLVCEVGLNENSWMDVEFSPQMVQNGVWHAKFNEFLREWQKLYKILPEFKIIVADMQNFFVDLRLWLLQIELGVRSQPAGDRLDIERETILAIQEPVVRTSLQILEKFELAAQKVDLDTRAAHMNYMRRQIHPLVLCSPFIHRTFYKPLGYAGDYEMVNMMIRDPYEGGSVFSKIMNRIFLSTPPVEAHRNRLTYLIQLLRDETLRVLQNKRAARIFNMGCGPAKEVQDFLTSYDVGQKTHFTLVDFNDETLAYTSKVLEDVKKRHKCSAQFHMVKKSVSQLLKEAYKIQSDTTKYDVVYCAGLLDYLTDPVSKRLLRSEEHTSELQSPM